MLFRPCLAQTSALREMTSDSSNQSIGWLASFHQKTDRIKNMPARGVRAAHHDSSRITRWIFPTSQDSRSPTVPKSLGKKQVARRPPMGRGDDAARLTSFDWQPLRPASQLLASLVFLLSTFLQPPRHAFTPARLHVSRFGRVVMLARITYRRGREQGARTGKRGRTGARRARMFVIVTVWTLLPNVRW